MGVFTIHVSLYMLLNNSFLWHMQIYVEIERARLTRMLAKIKEDQGDIAGNYTIFFFQVVYSFPCYWTVTISLLKAT